ncbi:class I SAM-dependent methyltransferase [Pirellulaceae bacterium SH467]
MGDDNRFAKSAFSDTKTVARYPEGPIRFVPGFVDMHRMTTVLLAERVPERGQVLVLGAGGGLELTAFAEAEPSWCFDGVDPSLEMLKLAEKTLGGLAKRVNLHHGFIDVAPEGPFDGATCLLTMHFVSQEERKRMANEIHRRLRPGAPFVVVHLSVPQSGNERALWLSRYAAYAVRLGIEYANANQAREAVNSQLTILSPESDKAILEEAGFSNVDLFYVGLAFRGWVGYA